MEWAIKLLEIVAVTFALVAMMMAMVIMSAIVGKALKKTEVKPKKRNKNMSKQASEGITFNDIFMFLIAVPLVLLWVAFAGFVIHSGLGKPEVLENIEAYTTLIAILGGPALLIIKDALDVWKQEQAEKTAFYKVKAQSVIDFNDAVLKQSQDIETKAQEQEHKMESKK